MKSNYKPKKTTKMKKVATSIHERTHQQLSDTFDSVYEGLKSSSEIFFILRRIIAPSLRVLTRNELTAVVDMLNGTMFQHEMATNQVLIAEIEDSEMYEQTCTRHGINSRELVEKVKNLLPVVVFFLMFEVSQFWRKSDTMMLESFLDMYAI